ncbi:hypothetical protein DJ56_4143 [Yersinia pestis]|nr:hypothetical protein DJ56_4143 [Yersinia pestis]KGA68137.1 hypothetical protein DJ55_4190 [Yersinia pseudotuberculosis]
MCILRNFNCFPYSLGHSILPRFIITFCIYSNLPNFGTVWGRRLSIEMTSDKCKI